jgi:RNA polymerase sigma-70 factor (ECF subfamily)
MTALAWTEEETDERAPSTDRPRRRLHAITDAEAERRRRIVEGIVADGLRPLQRMARRWAGSGVDADDLVQDTVEHALRAVDRFDEATNLQAWLRKIMFNAAVDRTRERRRRPTAGDVESMAAEEPAPPAAWSDVSIEQVRAAVRRLSEPLRTAYGLHADEHLSYLQMSARLGVPIGTIATRLHRARLQIRHLLENEMAVSALSEAAAVPVCNKSSRDRVVSC